MHEWPGDLSPSGQTAAKRRRLRLVAITDPGLAPWPALIERADLALQAGLPALLLRDQEADDADLLESGHVLRDLTRRHGALLLVNRRLGLATAIGADGVHLGRRGPRIGEARSVLGPHALVGYSAHSRSEAEDALGRGADYVFLSPIHPPRSKTGFLPALGVHALNGARDLTLALGGITAGNAAEAIRNGAGGVAAISEVFATADPRLPVGALLAAIEEGFLRRRL